jgi:phosphomethylpyrimidine synthase
MVSPSEHLALPDLHDIVEGTRAAKIAAHIGSLSRAAGNTRNREIRMAEARQALNWEKQFEAALFPGEARRIHERDGEIETCSMCGDLCAIKMVREILRAPEKRMKP